MRFGLVAAGLTLLLAAGATSLVHAADPLLDQLDALRAKRQYIQAETLCREQLADAKLPGARRAELTIEFSRTLAQHAMAAPADQAPALWREALDVVSDFSQRFPQDPKRLLVELQGALARSVQAEMAREQLDANSPREAVEAARELLRETIAEYRRLDREVDAEFQRRTRPDRKPSGLSDGQLQSLGLNARHELARALRNQALSYPASSGDRINALTQAVEIAGALAKNELKTPLAWSAALEEISDLRLLGEYPAAQRQLDRLEKSRPSDNYQQALRAERVRLALARGEVDEALSEAGAPLANQATGPEAELARLEALIAAWQRAATGKQADTAELERRVLEQAAILEKNYGPRWARKAERLVSEAAGSSTAGASPQVLARTAANHLRAGRLDEALAAYDLAVERGRAETDEAFQWGLAAADLVKQRGEFAQALQRYRALALASPEHKQASEAHLLAVYCAAQVAQAQQPPKLDEYRSLLAEHVARWPNDSTSAQAWSWLGRLAEQQRDWPAAVAALEKVRAGDPQYLQAVEALARVYRAWMTESPLAAADERKRADQALSYFDEVIGKPGASNYRPNPARRVAVLAAARIWLTQMEAGATPAERLLDLALEVDRQAPAGWQAAARRLLFVALVAQGKQRPTVELVQSLPRGTPLDTLELVEVLTAAAESAAAEDARTRLSEAALLLADDTLGRSEAGDEAVRRALQRARAGALSHLGRRDEALAVWRTLADAYPRDGEIQEQLAELLLSGEQADRQAALVKWQEIASKSRPGTPRWFRAHQGLARAQLALNLNANARATINQVAAKYPELGGADLRAQFEALLREAER